jgi:cytochrome c-type biogenesis protein CcmH/NrfG
MAAALNELRIATAADPTFARAQMLLGHLYVWDGRQPLAEEALSRADTLSPGTAEIHFYLAELERGRGQTPRAAELLRQALAEDPTPDVKRSIEDRLRELGALRANN